MASAFPYQLESTGERIFEFSIEALFNDDVTSATGVPGGDESFWPSNETKDCLDTFWILAHLDFRVGNLVSFG
jgi:hypothetical protein